MADRGCGKAPRHSSTSYDILGEMSKLKLQIITPILLPYIHTQAGITSAGPYVCVCVCVCVFASFHILLFKIYCIMDNFLVCITFLLKSILMTYLYGWMSL